MHAYTNDQSLLDKNHKDLRRARAAPLSMIPTSTGAAKTIGDVMPYMRGKLNGMSIRVPTPNVSMIDFNFLSKQHITVDDLHLAIKKYENEYPNILSINNEPLVSCDFLRRSQSAIFDCTQTQVIEGRLCKIIAWYDNEWGFAHRMLDLAELIYKNLFNKS